MLTVETIGRIRREHFIRMCPGDRAGTTRRAPLPA